MPNFASRFSTIPQIFFRNTHIGGYSELHQLLSAPITVYHSRSTPEKELARARALAQRLNLGLKMKMKEDFHVATVHFAGYAMPVPEAAAYLLGDAHYSPFSTEKTRRQHRLSPVSKSTVKTATWTPHPRSHLRTLHRDTAPGGFSPKLRSSKVKETRRQLA
jgi:hypothetical protein